MEVETIRELIQQLIGKARKPVALLKREAARELSMSQKTLERRIAAGQILTIDGGKRVPWSEIERFATPDAGAIAPKGGVPIPMKPRLLPPPVLAPKGTKEAAAFKARMKQKRARR